MTAREYLSKLEKIEIKIKQKTEERQELMQRATSITTSFGFDKVQTSPKHDKMEYSVVKAADLDKEIEEITFDFLVQKDRMINQIQELSEVKHIDLLFQKYVQHKKLETIAEEMNYSYQYVRKLHGKALKEFEKVHAEMLNVA